jgi:hypothetical protein
MNFSQHSQLPVTSYPLASMSRRRTLQISDLNEHCLWELLGSFQAVDILNFGLVCTFASHRHYVRPKLSPLKDL